jgi:hypothetical protein
VRVIENVLDLLINPYPILLSYPNISPICENAMTTAIPTVNLYNKCGTIATTRPNLATPVTINITPAISDTNTKNP